MNDGQLHSLRFKSLWGRFSYTPPHKTEKNEVSSGPPHPITQLPSELLEAIFRHLGVRDKGRVARVCRFWRDTVYCPSLWQDEEGFVDLDKWSDNLTLISSYNKRGIRRITVDFCTELFAGEPLSVRSAGGLAILSCTQPKRVVDHRRRHHIRLISLQMSQLTQLKILNYYSMSDSCLKVIAMNMKNLVSLDLSRCSNLTDNSLKHIAFNLTLLRRLNLESCTGITDEGVGYLAGCRCLIESGRVHPELEFLGLKECNRLTILSLSYLGSGQRGLITLEMDNNWAREAAATDDGLSHLAKLVGLREILFSGGYERRTYLEDVRTTRLIGKRKLRKLGLQNCSASEAGIVMMVKRLSMISWLDLSMSDYVTDEVLRQVAKLEMLRSLNVSFTSVGNRGLFHLAAGGMSKIETLFLLGCENVTDRGLRHLSKMPRLHELVLNGCCRITKQGLVSLSQGVATINYLDVSRCESIGWDGRILIFTGLFPRLHELVIDGYKNFGGSPCLTLAAHHLRDLRTLFVCDTISKEYSLENDTLLKIRRGEVNNGRVRSFWKRIANFRRARFT